MNHAELHALAVAVRDHHPADPDTEALLAVVDLLVQEVEQCHRHYMIVTTLAYAQRFYLSDDLRELAVARARRNVDDEDAVDLLNRTRRAA